MEMTLSIHNWRVGEWMNLDGCIGMDDVLCVGLGWMKCMSKLREVIV